MMSVYTNSIFVPGAKVSGLLMGYPVDGPQNGETHII